MTNDLVSWPEHLIEEIAFNRVILFLGSGVSSTSINSKGESMIGWPDFIDLGIDKMPKAKAEKRKYAKELLSKENYLLALETVRKHISNADFMGLIKREFDSADRSHSKAHEIIKKLDMKTIVTTNFDKLYDNYCSDHGHTIINYDETEKLASNLKQEKNIIIKAHGTIDNLDKIIFTQNDYFKSKRENPFFYKILESLFLTKTVLFLGYSLNDPDINLLLDTAANTATSVANHFVLIPEELNEELEEHWQDNYNVSSIRYGGGHHMFIPNLERLFDVVMAKRIESGLIAWTSSV